MTELPTCCQNLTTDSHALNDMVLLVGLL